MSANHVINADRLRADIDTLSNIGRDASPGAPRGLFRMALSEHDLKARDWLAGRIETAGLSVTRDGAANLGAIVGSDLGGPVVMTGSHLDTVPGAGHLDGALGVLTGLEALRTIHEQGIELRRPVELVAFTDEEGRFGGLLGSQAIAGDLSVESVEAAQDLSGIRLTDALKTVGLTAADVAAARRDPGTIAAFVELHIEQGPVLDSEGLPLGIVDSITGLFKWSVRFDGEANHAGTTPMNMRRDAFKGLVDFAQSIDPLLNTHGTPRSRATIGRVEVAPGAANVVPGRAEFSFEVRDTDPGVLERLYRIFVDRLEYVAYQHELGLSREEMSHVAPVYCDERILASIERTARDMDVPAIRMPSGAAHDTQVIARIAPVGMIFVPSKQGLSHSADEATDWEHIETGANVLLNTLIELAS